MKAKWIGLIVVVVIAGATPPRVLLAAVLSEANNPGDACAEIIHTVWAARDRGIAVQEVDSSSQSELLARYHVIMYPTVLVLDPDGLATLPF